MAFCLHRLRHRTSRGMQLSCARSCFGDRRGFWSHESLSRLSHPLLARSAHSIYYTYLDLYSHLSKMLCSLLVV